MNNKAYNDFVNKWANRKLYDSPYDYRGNSAGRIQMFREDNYKHPLFAKGVVADVFLTPKWIGWKDDKQRRQFYREAKMVGIRRKDGTKNEWYKIIDINE